MNASMKSPRSKTGSMCRTGSCAVVALPDTDQAFVMRRVLNRLGWRVTDAGDASEVSRLVLSGARRLAVLATDLLDESGWLTCAKLKRSAARLDVYLVGPGTPRNRRLARFVGAATLLTDPVEIADWLPPIQVTALPR